MHYDSPITPPLTERLSRFLKRAVRGLGSYATSRNVSTDDHGRPIETIAVDASTPATRLRSERNPNFAKWPRIPSHTQLRGVQIPSTHGPSEAPLVREQTHRLPHGGHLKLAVGIDGEGVNYAYYALPPGTKIRAGFGEREERPPGEPSFWRMDSGAFVDLPNGTQTIVSGSCSVVPVGGVDMQPDALPKALEDAPVVPQEHYGKGLKILDSTDCGSRRSPRGTLRFSRRP